MILYTRIYGSVRTVISPNQHGFMTKRSTVTNLACFTQFLCDSLDAGGQVDVVFTDIQKAFDQIDHYLLLSKLEAFGFSQNLIHLFRFYLTSRVQFVEHGGYRSQTYIATSGIPQGSNLGPLLFLIFINDITTVLDYDHLLSADDLKIFTSISSVTDCLHLQDQLNNIVAWCKTNFLQLNVSKCRVMTFTRNHNCLQFEYCIEDYVLDRCLEFKDLGVTFDTKLSFSSHICQITKSASRTLGYFLRNWNCFSNLESLKVLYFSFIRSKLEYAVLIWSPIYQCACALVESVQRKCLKFIFFKVNGFYPQRGIDNAILLSAANMISLRERRRCIAVSFLFNLLHNNIDCPSLVSKISVVVPRLNSRTINCFYNPFCRTNIMRKSPIYILCDTFNDIAHLCDINYDNLETIIECLLGRLS